MMRTRVAFPAIVLLSLCIPLAAQSQSLVDGPGGPPASTVAPHTPQAQPPSPAQNPQNAVYLNKLGISLHQQAALGPALRYYERAVKVDPTYADAENNIGTIYYQRKKYGKAIKAYQKAIAIRSDMPVLYSNLAYAYFEDKKYEEAIASFRQALALDPQLFERNSSRNGSILQDRTVADRGKFYFLLAKSFAQAGYKQLAAINMDPSFAAVIKNPAIQEILAPRPEDNPQI